MKTIDEIKIMKTIDEINEMVKSAQLKGVRSDIHSLYGTPRPARRKPDKTENRSKVVASQPTPSTNKVQSDRIRLPKYLSSLNADPRYGMFANPVNPSTNKHNHGTIRKTDTTGAGGYKIPQGQVQVGYGISQAAPKWDGKDFMGDVTAHARNTRWNNDQDRIMAQRRINMRKLMRGQDVVFGNQDVVDRYNKSISKWRRGIWGERRNLNNAINSRWGMYV